MIALKKINFRYDETFALHNISIEIQFGQIVGLIGESGSGKSTLLNILAGKIEANSGGVLLENVLLPKPSSLLVKGNSKIKVVTQANTLFPNISVFENIAYELRYFKENYKQKRTHYLLKLFNISKLKDKLPRELSGGELQRVMIAKAIADEPKVLLLDEPFSNLDVIIRQRVIFELKSVLSTENIACVLVTHEISDAFGMVDQLLILKKGKLIQKGTSEEIYFHPKNNYVGLLTGIGFFDEANKIFYRPENFIISSNGQFEGQVLYCKFQGFFYEIYFCHEGVNVFTRNHTKMEEGYNFSYNLNQSTLI